MIETAEGALYAKKTTVILKIFFKEFIMNENENKDAMLEEQGVEEKCQDLQIIEEETEDLALSDEEISKNTGHAVNNFFKKATVVGKKIAGNVQEVAITTSERIKEDNKNRRLKKYHPITLKEYRSKRFNIPNVIKIVDDAETRSIDVCADAIGRLVNEKNVEIFYINDEFIPSCGLHFVPAPVCNAIYHVDNFDRTRFIRTDEIFAKALEEKLAELEHIAFCLGARKCSIEIVENDYETSNRVSSTSNSDTRTKEVEDNDKGEEKGKKKTEKNSVGTSFSTGHMRQSKRNNHGKLETDFSQNSTPQAPRLKWFAHNDNVRNLIEMQLSQTGSVRSKTLELSGTSSASMTQKTAIAIDYEIAKMGIKGNSSSSIERQAQIEKNSTLIFEVFFEE